MGVYYSIVCVDNEGETMFGQHEDSQQQNTDTPTPDGALTDQTQSAPAVQDDPTQQQDYVPDTVQPAASDDSGLSNDDSTDVPAPTAADAVRVPSPPSSAISEELLQLKQQALQDLRPLVGHLEQTPSEKFRTLIMMIQASDNDAFIKDAYEAAHAIPDEKEKAQALLDVVNEINYFTQTHQD